ncbi:MAG: peptide chain release factor N(5)-glutamine methyltransferase [Herpetosiphon sp.]
MQEQCVKVASFLAMRPEERSYRRVLQLGTQVLANSSPSAQLDARLLLAFVCNVATTQLLAEWDVRLQEAEWQHFCQLLERRAAGEPIAYLVGGKEFYGRWFTVDKRVLVPRPETELLVERALQWARHWSGAPLRIADLGTGSGCIAVTLALELPEAEVTGLDLSHDALAVARQNVAAAGLDDRLRLLQHDAVVELGTTFDLVVANPPYTVLAQVDPHVRRFEPHLALDGLGADGFGVPRTWLRTIASALSPTGAVFMEIAAWQGDVAVAAGRGLFPRADVRVVADLAGRDRLLIIERPA